MAIISIVLLSLIVIVTSYKLGSLKRSYRLLLKDHNYTVNELRQFKKDYKEWFDVPTIERTVKENIIDWTKKRSYHPLLDGALSRGEFTQKYYRIYKEAYKYDDETLEVFHKLARYPESDLPSFGKELSN